MSCRCAAPPHAEREGYRAVRGLLVLRWLAAALFLAAIEGAAASDHAAPLIDLADRLAQGGYEEAAEAAHQLIAAPRPDQQQIGFPLPPRLDPPAELRAIPESDRWMESWNRARRSAAAAALAAAGAAAERGEAEAAFRLVWEAHRLDPTAQAPRRLLGLQGRDPAAPQVRPGTAAPPVLRWRPRSYITVQTDHFTLDAMAPRGVAVAFAEDLEQLYWIWTQVFFRVWADEGAVCAAIQRGQPIPRPRGRLRVALMKDRQAYLAQLRGQVAAVELSTGFYSPAAKLTLLYVDSDPATRDHELTHQLLQELLPNSPQQPGEHEDFWLVEGIACYMESLRRFETLATVGGWESPRLQYARGRWQRGDRRADLADIASEGMEGVQRRDDLAAWYTDVSAYTHFAMDGPPQRRMALLARLRRLYGDATVAAERSEALIAEATAQRLRDWLRLDDQRLYPLRPGTELRELNLGGTRITRGRLERLAPQPTLRWLDLSHTPADDSVVEHLLATADGAPLALEQLNLEGTAASDRVAGWIGRARELRELDLSFTSIGDATVAALGRARRLETLWLTGTEVTDASIGAIAALPALERVDLQRTAIGPQSLRRLNQRGRPLQVNPLQLVAPP